MSTAPAAVARSADTAFIGHPKGLFPLLQRIRLNRGSGQPEDPLNRQEA